MKSFKYDPVFKYLCVQNCIFHILNILGCKNSKHLMRCPINYHAKKNYLLEDKSVYKILFQKPNTNQCMLSLVDFKVFSSEDTEKIWSENKKMLNHGMPIIALVDVYYLHYRKEYQNLHGSHAVIVVDYYEDKGSVKIVDWYEPYFFIGLVKLNDFIRARNSENPKCANPYSGTPISNEWLYIFPNKYEVTKEDCLLENLSLSLRINDSKEEIYGTNSIKQIIILTESNSSKEYFKELHENLFPLWRLYDLLFSNIQEVINNYSNKLCLNTLLEYKNKFHELLFLILKLSVKFNEKSHEQLLKNIEAFYCYTQEMYDILQGINSFLLLKKQGGYTYD